MTINGLVITFVKCLSDEKNQWINVLSELLNFRKLHCSVIFSLAGWLTPYSVPFNIKGLWYKEVKSMWADQDLIELHRLNIISKWEARKLASVDSTILCPVSLLANTWGHRTPERAATDSLLYIIHNECSLTRPNPKESVSHTLPLLVWKRKWEIIFPVPSFWIFPCLFLLGWWLQL